LNSLDITNQGLRYARVLAQSTPRKRALLVGINRYPINPRFTPLQGCMTDVELQKELLIHRFGFQEADILCLTDDTPQTPTRDNILAAFQEHLINATQPGDVVVFHFSGHGDRVIDPTPVRDASGAPFPNSTFVPIDPQFDTDQRTVSDIMGKTLFLLVSALKTENVTLVLDSCYSGGGTRGNVRIRSTQRPSNRPGLVDLSPSEVELDYQTQWQRSLSLSPEELTRLRSESVAKGVVIAAAQRQQQSADARFNGLAADGSFNGFNAGVFTYFMTQYLWQQTASSSGMIAQVTRNLKANQFSQEPLADPQAGSGFEQQPIFFVNAIDTTPVPPAEAVIQSVHGNRATIWLGGVDQSSIVGFSRGATLTPIVTAPDREVRVISRHGLTAQVLLSHPLAPGTLLQESARVIPSDLKLRIGLALSLINTFAQVQQILQPYQRIELVPAQSGNLPYAGEVHYILGRMTTADRAVFVRNGLTPIPAVGSIGLFSQSLDEIIPDSFGDANESVENAIARLSSKLISLVAARLIKLTLNANSSHLNVEVLMRPTGSRELIGQAFTVRGGSVAPPQQTSNQLQKGQAFEFQVTNREAFDLFLCILVVGASGEMVVLFPNPYAEGAPQLRAGQTVHIPDPADSFDFVTEDVGLGEALIMVSRSPLQRAVRRLNNLAQEARTRGTFVTPTDDAIADLLADFSDTRSGSSQANVNPQIRTSDIAALSITFEVIE
ncbi:MAG TPA: caspase family protein, partial [Chroococcidiopsis sp.]